MPGGSGSPSHSRESRYGDTEFAIRDPDGHLLVFSELLQDPS
jgi:hypothetical protein